LVRIAPAKQYRLQLNPKESPDDRIQSTLTSISNTAATTTFDDLQRDLETLTALTQDLLKNEWEKVKREAEERTVMKPQGGAIGRQPSGPDTTRTSATVASSRSP